MAPNCETAKTTQTAHFLFRVTVDRNTDSQMYTDARDGAPELAGFGDERESIKNLADRNGDS